jgi:prepilin-type N-terminal cleavage/methylation domain-containing protein/prepilin-type processing-associated H-X9-DG protein
MKRNTGRSGGGFTLVELLVVIGIIALLISILLPALAKARSAAREVRCESNIRQFGVGLQMYCDANKGVLPFGSNNGSKSNPVDFIPAATASQPSPPYAYPNGLALGWAAGEMWFNAIPPMLNLPTYYSQISANPAGGAPIPTIGDPSIYICPSLNSLTTALNETANVTVIGNGGYFGIWGDPVRGVSTKGNTVQYPVCMCYVPNSKLISGSPFGNPKLSQCVPSANVAVFVEKRMDPGEINSSDPQYANLTSSNPSGIPWSWITNPVSGNAMGQLACDFDRLSSRHRNGGYICFADGHVGWYSLDQVIVTNSASQQASVDDFNDPANVIWNPFGTCPK